ncbi:hypothetical protein [Hyunsoonleella ulvae]|uniref:hypothetical protein n=1 Tax=Hyunsoonleella ulvae TaxID=2799948 RepID=UPI00193A2C9F|nr:hypothetical protein [Hyunsoonleella ulvae]
MKFKFLAPILFLSLIFSCSVDNADPEVDTLEAQSVEIFQWHLTNVSGGIAGVDVNFEVDTIVWVFNVDFVGNGTLKVLNNNTDTSLEDGLDTGTYSISIPVYGTQSIIFIDGEEYAGLLTPTEEDLIINQNIKSDGAAATDGFIYTFKRRIVTDD